MTGFQSLTLEQLQTVEGVSKLNDILRQLFNAGNHAVFPYGLNSSTSADAYAAFTDGVVGTSSIGIRMPANGSIIRHSCLLNVTTATTGDVTAEVRIGDSNQSDLEIEFNSSAGTGVASNDVSADRHAVTFSKGDLVQIYLNETGTMVWEDVIGFIEVTFDNDQT